MSDLSGLNPTPHAIAVYASRPLSPEVTQHSLPSGRCPLLGPVFHRLDRTSLPGALTRSPRRRGRAMPLIVLTALGSQFCHPTPHMTQLAPMCVHRHIPVSTACDMEYKDAKA